MISVEHRASKNLLLLGILLVAMSTSMYVLTLGVFPSTNNAVDRAVQLARDFIIQAPTFGFDGIPETFNVTKVSILESFPLQYDITIYFGSRHAGYGDRTGQVLAQVITPHTAVVRVIEDEVVSAILDGQWDEVNQEPISVLQWIEV